MAVPIIIVSGPSGAGKSTSARLIADEFDPSVLLRTDEFMGFVVNGWTDPDLAASAHQNHVLGGAVVSAAFQFAEGGYTVVIDGHIFPDAINALAGACAARGVELHYVVLRPDLATCMHRVSQRPSAVAVDPESVARLHDRFADLGDYESNVVAVAGPPESVVASILVELAEGRFARR